LIALETLDFAFRSALQNFWRNGVTSFAAVFTTTLLLLVVSAFLVVSFSFNNVISHYEQSASSISLYIADGSSAQAVDAARRVLKADHRVRRVVYISKDQAKKNFEADPNYSAELKQSLNGNPLPASFTVTVWNLKALGGMDSWWRQQNIHDPTDATDLQSNIIDRLITVTQVLRIIGLVVIGVLGSVALLIIVNTIRVAAFVRRTEIEIMKLVGASEWFVKWPFILEGMVCGFIAAATASVLVLLTYKELVQALQRPLFFLPIVYDATFQIQLIEVLLLVGLGIGAAGSYISVRRFVRI
jgi:cell division transport system permease protein